MLLLTKEELKPHQDAKVCYTCGKYFFKKLAKSINYREVRGHCHYIGKYRSAAHNICNLKFNLPHEIPVVFYNGSNYDYHFTTKELANEFDGQFKCIRENKEKYKTFVVLMKKEIPKKMKMVMKVLHIYLPK